MGHFNDIIQKLKGDYQLATDRETGEGYVRLSTIFGELDDYLREYMQGLTEDKMKAVIKKLKSGEPLTEQDKEEIRLWIVGDADYYFKLENNYQDWKHELARLMDVISALPVDDPDAATVMKMQGLFRDAERTIADIMYYLQQKDRLEKFNDSIQQIDDEERVILVRLLEQKLKSPDF